MTRYLKAVAGATAVQSASRETMHHPRLKKNQTITTATTIASQIVSDGDVLVVSTPVRTGGELEYD